MCEFVYFCQFITPEQIEPGTIVVTEEDDNKRLEFARSQVIGTGKKVEVNCFHLCNPPRKPFIIFLFHSIAECCNKRRITTPT